MAEYSASLSAETVSYVESEKTVRVPEEYQTSGIEISGSAQISGGYNPASDVSLVRHMELYWKDKDGVERQLITRNSLTVGYYTTTIDLTDTTIFKFKIIGSKSYAGTGQANYGPEASGRVTFTGTINLPWGSITTETFITANKLNTASTILDANVSVTAGTLITRAPWQTVGDKKNIVFDNTKPLLQDLQNLVDVSPGVWGSDPY